MAISAKDWLKQLTLEEKASLCSGRDFWSTKAVERLGIPSWTMTDGPHGLRKQRADGDGVDLHNSVPATCFPSGSGLASTWNRDLIEAVGQALGKESKAEQVGVILGPGANIKRSPLGGRNFEYFSEDPYLAGQMAKHHILGVQSQGVGASLKHFAANNQEKNRMTIDTIVDERTLREIYLPAFETAVKEAQPWTVMCSYNKINGTFVSELRWLLMDVLKDEWGHQGLVVTDWGACNDRVEGLKAGQELEMPGNGGLNDRELVDAVRAGKLKESDLDQSVLKILELTEKVLQHLDTDARFNAENHHSLARRTACESFVLLKNDKNLLPLAKGYIALIGVFAQHPRYQGGGSSHITPTQLDSAVQELTRLSPAGTKLDFAPGFSLRTEEDDPALVQQAIEIAGRADTVVLFLGLTDIFESEGFDRTHLRLPANQTHLVEQVLKVQKNVVVLLSNGSPIEMPWSNRVGTILETYLGGQAWGGAVADVLWGKVSPSGKLAETFPVRLQDTPSYLHFPGDGDRVEYREGIFVGYRYHDAAQVEPLFPFGHGLSYTTFQYGKLRLSKNSIKETDAVTVSVDVTNKGSVAGAEVVQLYVRPRDSLAVRPPQELKGFAKVFLAPGETKTVALGLERRAFAFWSSTDHEWTVESGDFEIAVGSSSRDTRGTAVVTVSAAPRIQKFDFNTRLGDLVSHPVGGSFVQGVLRGFQAQFGSYDPESAEARMMEIMAKEMPLRNLFRMSSGRVPPALVDALLAVVNGTKDVSALGPFIPK